MILLFDADSLVFASCYRPKTDDIENIFYTDIADSINKFDEQFMKIVNDLEEKYEIEKVITFNGCKGNFRKKLSKNYKAIEKNKHSHLCYTLCTIT